MLEPTVHCYCDFSISNDAVAAQVEDVLQGVSKEFGFQEQFIRYTACEDQGWTGNILKAMEGLSDQDYFFVWFDDLLAEKGELSLAISSGIKQLGDYSYIRITGRPSPIGDDVGNGFKLISENESYQCSLVGSLWSVGYFKSLVTQADTPWRIEGKKHKGTAIGAVRRLYIKNTKIKGKDNVFHHPRPTFTLENVLASIPWGIKRLVRETLCRFPRFYHWLYSK